MDSILTTPEWPASLAQFVTWCLMWDPKVRPTSTQALAHEYFADAFDPIRPKSSASRFLGRKQGDLNAVNIRDSNDSLPSMASKGASWFRRSVVARESAPAVPQHVQQVQKPPSPRPSPVHAHTTEVVQPVRIKPVANKRATWANTAQNGAPMPILPSIRPVSPLSDAVTAQAAARQPEVDEKAAKKIGRQLSVASHGNHYPDAHRQEAERALNGQSGVSSPPSSHKEGFFSHLRKRARRFSGRYPIPMSPNSDDIEANAGCAPWASSSNRQSMVIDSPSGAPQQSDFTELDKALQNVRYSVDASSQNSQNSRASRVATNPMLKRHHSLPHGEARSAENSSSGSHSNTPMATRIRRAMQKQPNPSNRYETPDEEDELLNEALTNAHSAAKRLDRHSQAQPSPAQPPMQHSTSDMGASSYLTPSPSAKRNSVNFGQNAYVTPTRPLDIKVQSQQDDFQQPKWPTPPYEDNDWAAAAQSIFANSTYFR